MGEREVAGRREKRQRNLQPGTSRPGSLSRSIIRDASSFLNASWGKYSHCEITCFYTKSLYQGDAIYHSFNARHRAASLEARSKLFQRARRSPEGIDPRIHRINFANAFFLHVRHNFVIVETATARLCKCKQS